jgi:hypothetical protein
VFAIISGIKSKNVLEDGINDLENIWRYDWHIDTKYYTADIQLCCTTGRTIGNKEFSELVQAVIIYFDPQQVATCTINYFCSFINSIASTVIVYRKFCLTENN